MKAKKSWDHKWYTDEFLAELKATACTVMDGGLPVTVKYAPDAGSELAIDPRLLGGPLGRNAKKMALLPDFLLDRVKMRTDSKGIAAFRKNCDQVSSAVCVRGGMELLDGTVIAADGYEIPIRVYRSEGCRPGCPCLYFMHGGGFIGGGIRPYDEVWKVFVEKFHVVVVSAAYRLLPENPYPMPYEDCFRVLEWIHTNAALLDIDPDDAAGLWYRRHPEDTRMYAGQLMLLPALAAQVSLVPRRLQRGALNRTLHMLVLMLQDSLTPEQISRAILTLWRQMTKAQKAACDERRDGHWPLVLSAYALIRSGMPREAASLLAAAPGRKRAMRALKHFLQGSNEE